MPTLLGPIASSHGHAKSMHGKADRGHTSNAAKPIRFRHPQITSYHGEKGQPLATSPGGGRRNPMATLLKRGGGGGGASPDCTARGGGLSSQVSQGPLLPGVTGLRCQGKEGKPAIPVAKSPEIGAIEPSCHTTTTCNMAMQPFPGHANLPLIVAITSWSVAQLPCHELPLSLTLSAGHWRGRSTCDLPTPPCNGLRACSEGIVRRPRLP